MPESKRLNVVFVCSMNQWRSPTAEKIYSDDPEINVRSRGTHQKARQTIGSDDLKWANVVMVMEQKHLSRIQSRFPGETRFLDSYVLDIPDEFQFMDPELIREIRAAADPVFASFRGAS